MFVLVAPVVLATAASAGAQTRLEARQFYQGRRGAEQSDTVSRRIRLGRDGRVSIQNISGQITVTTGPGDEVSIEAVKRSRGDRGGLDRVDVIIEEHAGRIDVRTEHRSWPRSDDVSVDYTVVVPESSAVEAKSVSGNIKVTGAKGSVRVDSVSGNVAAINAPHLEHARTVSGNVDLTNISTDGDVSVSSVSGNVRADGIKGRELEVSTVSGDISMREASCDRMNAHSVSGGIEYAGTLAKNGRYEVNSHSGRVRFTLSGDIGFELNATSFSGSVRSELPLTIGGDRNQDVRSRGRGPNRGGTRATFGDGSALLDVRTFSGDIVIAKR